MKIDKKIVSVEIVKSEAPPKSMCEPHKLLVRPEYLNGTTYKIKPATGDHAIFITINNVTIDVGKPSEKIKPFEIFINSKDMSQFQYIVALTRVISAVFRAGGNSEFIIEELVSVFDPTGGYFLKGKFYPSVVAHIGCVIKQHFDSINGVEPDNELVIAAKAKLKNAEKDSDGIKENATFCEKCMDKTVVRLDGCPVCLNCGDSKCS